VTNRLSRLAVLVGLVLAVSACGFVSGTPGPESFDGLEKTLEKAHDAGTPVAIKDLTPFDWDRVYVFSGYLDGRHINEELGLKLYSEDNEVVTEDFWLLVFMEQGKPVRTILVSYPAHLGRQTLGNWDNSIVFGPIAQDGTWGFTSAIAPPSPSASAS
jgi:hypothetical protein